MAAAAVAADVDADQQGVLVAIDPHLDDPLDLPAGGALVPELAPRARPVPRLAGLDRARQRFGIHVGEHQHPAVAGIDRDAGDQAVPVEAGRQGRAFLDRGLRAGGIESDVARGHGVEQQSPTLGVL
jgi:hypothetical protein